MEKIEKPVPAIRQSINQFYRKTDSQSVSQSSISLSGLTVRLLELIYSRSLSQSVSLIARQSDSRAVSLFVCLCDSETASQSLVNRSALKSDSKAVSQSVSKNSTIKDRYFFTYTADISNMLFTVASVSISLLQILYFNLLPVGSTIGAFPATSGSVGDSFKSKKISKLNLCQ